MASALRNIRNEVGRDQVIRAAAEYDRLGADDFFATHGYGPSRSYELVLDGGRYPHKAILGTAYELATGERLDPGDFEGGKAGAVAVLEDLGFVVRKRERDS